MIEHKFKASTAFKEHGEEVQGVLSQLKRKYPSAKFYGDYETFGKADTQNKANLLKILDSHTGIFVINIEVGAIPKHLR